MLPYTRINGSTFPAPDPALVSQTPPVSDPDYSTKIIDFTLANAPNTFEGLPVNFGTTFSTTVTAADAPNDPASLLPLFNLQIWGAPTSQPAYDPNNRNFVYQRFQRGIMHFDSDCTCTQGLLLADYLKSLLTGQNLPPDLAQQAQADNSRFLNQYAPSQPLWIARPGRATRQRSDECLHRAAGRRRRRANPLAGYLGLRVPGAHDVLQPGREAEHDGPRPTSRFQLAQAPGGMAGDPNGAGSIQLGRA